MLTEAAIALTEAAIGLTQPAIVLSAIATSRTAHAAGLSERSGRRVGTVSL
jgi:hypothetical protein